MKSPAGFFGVWAEARAGGLTQVRREPSSALDVSCGKQEAERPRTSLRDVSGRGRRKGQTFERLTKALCIRAKVRRVPGHLAVGDDEQLRRFVAHVQRLSNVSREGAAAPHVNDVHTRVWTGMQELADLVIGLRAGPTRGAVLEDDHRVLMRDVKELLELTDALER